MEEKTLSTNCAGDYFSLSLYSGLKEIFTKLMIVPKRVYINIVLKLLTLTTDDLALFFFARFAEEIHLRTSLNIAWIYVQR